MGSKRLGLLVAIVALFVTACVDAEVRSQGSTTGVPESQNPTNLANSGDDLCGAPDEIKELLKLHNQARRKRVRCDGKRSRKAKALVYSCLLADASWQHASDMAENNYLAHNSRDGLSIGQRATRSGYVWRRIGENIAQGFGSARMANNAWLGSKGHCNNIMDPKYTEMGAAIVGKHWVVMFGNR